MYRSRESLGAGRLLSLVMLHLLVFVLMPNDMALVPRVENSGNPCLLFDRGREQGREDEHEHEHEQEHEHEDEQEQEHEQEDEQEDEQEQEHGHEKKSGIATVRERTRGPTAKSCVLCVSR